MLNIVAHYFGGKSKYDRTKKKLVGLTIPFSISIEEVFTEIVSEYIEDKHIREYVETSKNKIIKLFEHEEHKNLRTLITACIAIENIISSIFEDETYDREVFDEQINQIILYIIKTSIEKTNGKDAYVWVSNIRYGYIERSDFKTQNNRIYGYAFVDEYWKTKCVDSKVISSDIKMIMEEKIDLKKRIE